MDSIVLIGHSMANGTVEGPDAGDPVQAGWTLYTAGSPVANYPTGNSPSVSIIKDTIDAAIATGATNGLFVRRATNGISLGSSFDTLIYNSRLDVIAAGSDPAAVKLVLLWCGANDALTQAATDQYMLDTGLERTVALTRDCFPNAEVILIGEETDDPVVTYARLASINAHKQTVAALFPFCQYVAITGVDLADDIHPDVTPEGFPFVVECITDVWLGP